MAKTKGYSRSYRARRAAIGGGPLSSRNSVTARGAFVTDGLIRGLVLGRATIGRNTPAVRLDIGGGRTTVTPESGLRRIG